MCQMQRKYVKNLCVYCDSTHKVAVNENVSLYVLALKTNTGFQVTYQIVAYKTCIRNDKFSFIELKLLGVIGW